MFGGWCRVCEATPTISSACTCKLSGGMETNGEVAHKTNRSKRGKGRKERMKAKIEKMALENEEHQQRAKELAGKNLELRRLVVVSYR